MRFLLCLGGTLLIAGCSSVSSVMGDGITSVITPYRVEVVQGNVVTREQMARVKPGASRNEVRNVLGSPLLADPFHADRWDYSFLIRRPGTEPQQRNVVVYFTGDHMDRIEAPELPSEVEFVAAISRPLSGQPPTLALTEAQRAALPVPAPPATAAAAAEPQGANRRYPPLEQP
ncbi:MAG: outer membrane protein assembly factor BamE [Proteobacteria bacterium]|nr:outer membrane protein assembly factor BamE [Pseudomonadota bacterium]